MSTCDSNIRMRSIHAAAFPDDVEAKSGVRINDGDGGAPPTADAADGLNESSNDPGAPDPLQLPPSTHSLLFTQPVCSLPFAFASGIVLLSYACLWLVYYDNFNEFAPSKHLIPNLPVNISPTVRVAQYLSIFIVLLMEEEIPTGLYLLRMIPRASFEEQFPDLKYSRFILSSVLRTWMGVFFLFNVFTVLAQATEVLAIFYDVLALQFIQQLDDIAFALAKMDVLGKGMQRACTAKCFQTEFERRKSGRSKKLSIFLKAVYFFNLGWFLAGMMVISGKQLNGSYQADSITVDFGSTVWEEALVKMPLEFHQKWLQLYPFFDGVVTPDAHEKWKLVFSYFNGVYKRSNDTRAGRPVYKEMRKVDNTEYALIVPAEIYYCKGIRSWVFAHKYIQKSKEMDKSGCDWLLRSEETDEYDLMNVGMTWKIWNGVIGNTQISYSDNECSGETDCNLNGQCKDGTCHCNSTDGVQYLGSHCEIALRDECQTIIGELHNLTFSVAYYPDHLPGNGLDQRYSRPLYHMPMNEGVFYIAYSGSRWFGQQYSLSDLNITWEYLIFFAYEFQAFWGRSYSSTWTKYVSDETKKDTPVGVDFYEIGERDRAGQFGPFGELIPIQRFNLSGRGYFRCGGPLSSLGNASATERKLQFQNHLHRNSWF